MKRRREESGFTLIETLVGLAIFSGVLIAIYAALSSALNTASRIVARQEAVDAVEAEFRRLRAETVKPADRWDGETSSYRWTVAVSAVPGNSSHGLLPLRISGHIVRKAGAGLPELVADTIVLGHGG